MLELSLEVVNARGEHLVDAALMRERHTLVVERLDQRVDDHAQLATQIHKRVQHQPQLFVLLLLLLLLLLELLLTLGRERVEAILQVSHALLVEHVELAAAKLVVVVTAASAVALLSSGSVGVGRLLEPLERGLEHVELGAQIAIRLGQEAVLRDQLVHVEARRRHCAHLLAATANYNTTPSGAGGYLMAIK